MLTALKRNDRVLTGAGIYGTVVSVDENADRVVLRIDDDRGVKVAFSKASIVRVLDADKGAGAKEKESDRKDPELA
jgi:preprotein translocase subunit YajC